MEITNLQLIPYTDIVDEKWQSIMIEDEDEGLLLDGLYPILGYENCFYIYNLKDNIMNFTIALLLVALYYIIKKINRKHFIKNEN